MIFEFPLMIFVPTHRPHPSLLRRARYSSLRRLHAELRLRPFERDRFDSRLRRLRRLRLDLIRRHRPLRARVCSARRWSTRSETSKAIRASSLPNRNSGTSNTPEPRCGISIPQRACPKNSSFEFLAKSMRQEIIQSDVFNARRAAAFLAPAFPAAASLPGPCPRTPRMARPRDRLAFCR